METQTNGFLWTLLTRKKTKKLKQNLIKNKIERANTELTRESDSTKPQSQTRMFSKRKKTFLSFTLFLFYLFVAPVIQVLPVYSAEPAAALTVWDIMITELLGANVIIADTAVESAYAGALASLNAATATAAEIDAAISSAASQCGVDLAGVFANTAASAASVGIEAEAASAGANIAASCAAATASGGQAAVIPALGGVLLNAGFTAAIVGGLIHIGKMWAQDYGDLAKYSAKLDQLNAMAQMDFSLCDMTGPGSLFTLTKHTSTGMTQYYGHGFIKNNIPCSVNPSNSSKRVTFVRMTQSNSGTVNKEQYSANVSSRSVGNLLSGNLSGYIASGEQLPSNFNINEFLAAGGAPFPSTRSFASSNGFQKYNPDYTTENNPDVDIPVPYFPELKPLPDYDNGYGLKPINANDYALLVQSLNDLPSGISLQDQLNNDSSIAELLQPIIDPALVPIGDPNPGPQPTGSPDPQPTGSPDPQPTGSPNPNPNPRPNTNPFPNPETVPQVTPVVNPTPDSEIAPAPVPYPDPETPTEQDKTDTDTKITPIDLRDKFPFCIPFDMLKIMKLFQGGREAPCFTWNIPFGIAGQGSVTIDLAPWDSVATIMRTMELILFIMLLAVGTRNLLGGSS